MSMLWDIHQSARITQNKARADAASDRAADAKADVQCLESSIDRLLLINRALWEMMAEQFGLEESAIADKITEIDLRDGQKDGRLRKDVQKCPKCDRHMNRRHNHCLYCGAEGLEPDVFDVR